MDHTHMGPKRKLLEVWGTNQCGGFPDVLPTGGPKGKQRFLTEFQRGLGKMLFQLIKESMVPKRKQTVPFAFSHLFTMSSVHGPTPTSTLRRIPASPSSALVTIEAIEVVSVEPVGGQVEEQVTSKSCKKDKTIVSPTYPKLSLNS